MLHLPANPLYCPSRRNDYLNPEPETNPHDGKSGVIRTYINDYKVSEWGFAIVRCDYTSQQRWEKFLSFIREDAKVYLDWNHDLWDSMAWSVIEDQGLLDGADYETASESFGKWVDGDIGRMCVEAEQKGVDVDLKGDTDLGTGSKDEALQSRAPREAEPRSRGSLDENSGISLSMQHFSRSDLPRHQFFIYVDKSVIDSVVDIADPTTPRDIPGAYFMKVCCQHFIMEKAEGKRSRAVWKAKHAAGEELTVEELEEEADLDGWDPDDEEFGDDSEEERECIQRFKAFKIVELYASLVGAIDDWPDSMSINL